ncbi:MAG: PEGA domain-containing protein [Bacteroidales bacterium]|nr:PEGA domain-containing protein [Bacteroidales bacterium]
MKRTGLALILLFSILAPLRAQEMGLEDFAKVKRPPWKWKTVEVDKTCALLDLLTDEQGFQFTCGANVPVEAKPGEGLITLSLPNKTTHLTITHPEFGQLMWRVPGSKKLHKNNRYRAVLLAGDPTKEYKSPKQWLVLNISPRDVMLQIDSVSKPVRGEVQELYLPVGKHGYKVEAPFYMPVQDTVELTPDARAEITVQLQPFYSFLTVKAPRRSGTLYIDNARISKAEATSYRLFEGCHNVSIFRKDKCWYDSLLVIGRAEKKVLELAQSDLYPRPRSLDEPLSVNPPAPEDSAGVSLPPAPVKITVGDPETEIWVDREYAGKGQWEGTLSQGFHLAQTRKDSLSSDVTTFWIRDEFPQEITLKAFGMGYGLLNIHCNVEGAGIKINGGDYGQTPKIVRLDASKIYKVALSKDGYKDGTLTVRPRGNNMVDVYMKLKKKRI